MASELADSGGLSAVSMRAVAGGLGIAAGSLYRYLSSRDDLLDLMVDAALAELRLDWGPGAGWLDDLLLLAHDQLALYRKHPWLLEASMRGGTFGPHATDYFEYCLRVMAALPCGTATKMEVIAMITGVVSLFARSAPPDRRPTSSRRLFSTVSAHVHPHLTAALSRPATSPPQSDLFERTIRSVIGGLVADS